MTRGIHYIITAYGFWLPNDPRGSWSDVVRAWELRRFGDATGADIRRSVAAAPHDQRLRQRAKAAMSRAAVIFNGHQALAIAEGIRRQVERSRIRIHACSVLPDHMHLVVSGLHIDADKAAELLKASATAELGKAGLHPFDNACYGNGRLPSPWARHCWKVFLYDDASVRRAIRYVERNPEKEGKRPQHWRFVTPYTPWDDPPNSGI